MTSRKLCICDLRRLPRRIPAGPAGIENARLAVSNHAKRILSQKLSYFKDKLRIPILELGRRHAGATKAQTQPPHPSLAPRRVRHPKFKFPRRPNSNAGPPARDPIDTEHMRATCCRRNPFFCSPRRHYAEMSQVQGLDRSSLYTCVGPGAHNPVEVARSLQGNN